MTRPLLSYVDDGDRALLGALEDGLPICTAPFEALGKTIDMSEQEVLARLARMKENRIISRFGLVLHHRQLGYRANAMVVWDIPDHLVDACAAKITENDFVTLCYCRTRRLPAWKFNLYCMIHGRERHVVEKQIESLKAAAGLDKFDSRTLFSKRCFKQRGARFTPCIKKLAAAE